MKSLFKMVACSMLIAMSIVATRLLGVQIGNYLRLSFGGIPIIFAGIVFGPLAGAIVGALADLVGFMLNPMGGAYIPGFTLSSMLTGLLPALMMNHVFKKYSFAPVFVTVAVTQVITNTLLNSLWIYMLVGSTMWLNFPIRIISQAVMIPMYATVIYVLVSNRVLQGYVNAAEPA